MHLNIKKTFKISRLLKLFRYHFFVIFTYIIYSSSKTFAFKVHEMYFHYGGELLLTHQFQLDTLQENNNLEHMRSL